MTAGPPDAPESDPFAGSEGPAPMSKRWIVTSAMGWPLLHVVVFRLRFGAWPQEASPLDFAWFGLTGAIGAWAVIALSDRASSARERGMAAFGALLLAPIAVAGNLLGGLLGPVGVVVFGAVPLAVGAWLGARAGRIYESA